MTYHNPDFGLAWLTDGFAPITLDQLNEKAEMLTRIDNKYVVQNASLRAIAATLISHFDILDIDNRRSFTYDTRYFDDAQRSAYFEHHQGVRKGFKVRVRRYLDAGLCYLEVKVKGERGATEKFRQPYDPEQLDRLTPEAFGFARETYANQYCKPFDYVLAPALDIRYRRITLVAKSGGERMTIDTDLHFATPNGALSLGTDVFIVETKSANGRGLSDRLLRSMGERPSQKCSKYCIGMAAMGEVSRYNRFLPTMRKLGMLSPAPRLGRWSELKADYCHKVASPLALSTLGLG